MTRLRVATVFLSAISACAADAFVARAQQPPTTPVRTVMAVASLPTVVDAPRFFGLWKMELPAGASTSYRGPIGFLYVLSGSLSVGHEARRAMLQPGDALLLAAGDTHNIAATGASSANFLHFLLSRSTELEQRPARAPAIATELFRGPEPISSLKPGPHEFTLTRVAFPPRMPPNLPHYRSGAALYYIESGFGTFIADGKSARMEPGKLITSAMAGCTSGAILARLPWC